MKQTPGIWQTFTAAPHRVMFLAGAAQGIGVMAWWLCELASRYGLLHAPLAWTIPPTWAHAYLMIYGLFPFFIFGFLFTTYPNWMNGEKIPRRWYVPAFLLLAGGVALFYAGLAAGKEILATAATLMLCGWGMALYALLHVLIRSPHQDKRHPIATSMALAMGWLGIASYLAWLLTQNQVLLDFARIGGIWFFLLPIFMTVSHRMIPFFSSRVLRNYVVIRPYWMLWAALACMAGHGALQLAGASGWLWLFDLPLALLALYLSRAWGLRRSFSVRLLALLHIAFLWLGVALALYALQSLILFASGGKTYLLGFAPLHALTIGYFASMMLGMASRVTLGHSGHELVADNATWLLFLGFQTVALMRVLPDVFPVLGAYSDSLYLLAALLWLASFIPWAFKYAPSYWRPRADGKPG